MSSAQSAPAGPNLFCISCGYNQRGITTNRCPECGQDFTALPPSTSRLPWLHRRHLGLLRAYWRTAAMVFFRPKLFCDQIDNPISLKDARLFWLLSIFQACLPLLVLLIYFAANKAPGRLDALKQLFFRSLYLPVPSIFFFLAGFILFLIASTGMPSYFCHPRALPIGVQNKAIALSYFTSAPIALLPLIFALAIAGEFVTRLSAISKSFHFIAALAATFMLGVWYIRTAGILLALSQRRRRILTVLLLTLSWIFLLVLCLMLIPLALWYAGVTARILF